MCRSVARRVDSYTSYLMNTISNRVSSDAPIAIGIHGGSASKCAIDINLDSVASGAKSFKGGFVDISKVIEVRSTGIIGGNKIRYRRNSRRSAIDGEIDRRRSRAKIASRVCILGGKGVGAIGKRG